MFCKNCGSEYPFGENICSSCGQVRVLHGEELEAYIGKKIIRMKIEMEETRAEYEEKISSRIAENSKLEQELALIKKEYQQELKRKERLIAKRDERLRAEREQQFMCRNCGAEHETGIFCSKCGTKLR